MGKNHIIRRIQAGLLIGLLVSSLLPVSAFAADRGETIRESITLSPVSKRYEIKAGASKTDSLKVINDGRVAYDFVVYTRPYSVNDESYVPDFTSDAQNADAYRWVQFEKSSYHLEAGQSVEVKYTVRVPETATPGGHYGVLFAETQPEQTNEGNAVIRKKRVGSILYATVDGDVTRSGKLLSTSVPFLQIKPPLTANLRVANSGNTDFSVKSTMTISDVFGGKKFNSEREVAVLPSTTRKISMEWPGVSWIGLYKVEMTTSFLDNRHESTHYVLQVPLWVYALLILLIGTRILYAVARRKHS